MDALPTGEVTMLFTDIEGSTRLAREAGAAWPQLLTLHRGACREIWRDHRGHEIGTEGDSFFVAFASASEAVGAAAAAQRVLASLSWPGGRRIRVRMGVHTGWPVRLEEGYAGLDVHRAARVAGVAHGGQVLVTEQTLEVVRREGHQIEVTDLGWHQLKDLPDRLHLLQLGTEGSEAFPLIRSRGRLSGLPASFGPMVGRDEEISRLSGLLGKSDVRLLTLTGPGGTGKTRLAIQVAEATAARYPDGVYFAALQTARRVDEAWPLVSSALGLTRADGEADSLALEELSTLDGLLVLDNLEQLQGASELVEKILATSPTVMLLATSRAPVHVRGEQVFAVAPLPTPTEFDLPTALASPAVELFVDLARLQDPGFSLTDANAAEVAAIVCRLDGLPLAIEIVAAQIRVFGPAALAARVGRTLDLAHRGRPHDLRQHTMREAIAWSYHLLSSDHRLALLCLGAFQGGASVPAAQSVVATVRGGRDDVTTGPEVVDLLFDLVESSLVVVRHSEGGEPRFGLLETVNAFAVDQLAAEDLAGEVHDAHAQYFYDFAVKHHEAFGSTQHGEHRQHFIEELANLRVVLERHPHRVQHPQSYGDTAVPFGHVAALFARVASLYVLDAEADQWARLTLADPGLDELSRAAALGLLTVALSRRADASGSVTDRERAIADLTRALELLGGHERRHLPAWIDPVAQELRLRRFILIHLIQLRHTEVAEPLVAELDRLSTTGSAREQAMALDPKWMLATVREDFASAREVLMRQTELFGRAGAQHEQLWQVVPLAETDLQLGERDTARARIEESLAALIELGDVTLIAASADALAGALAQVDPVGSARLVGAIAAFREREHLPALEASEHFEHVEPGIVALGRTRWDAEVLEGRRLALADLLLTTTERHAGDAAQRTRSGTAHPG